MTEYLNYLSEHIRRQTLEILEQDATYAHNEAVLHSALAAVGHRVSRDRLRGELDWLAEQGLITLETAGSVRIASLTARGEDVALGRVRVSGVARRLPG